VVLTVRTFDLYGSRVTDISGHLRHLSQVLGVEWEERSSDYKGDYYHATDGRYGGAFEIRPNAVPGEVEPAESGFPEYGFLLYASRPQRPDELRSVLTLDGTWTLLRRTEV
jgi:hypothetical protein